MPLRTVYYGLHEMPPHRLGVTCHMTLVYILCIEFLQESWVRELELSCWQHSYDAIDGILDMTQFVESFYLGTAQCDIDGHLTLRTISSNLLRYGEINMLEFLHSFHI